MNNIKKLLSAFALALLAFPVMAGSDKIDLQVGFFSINAKANGESSSISNPSAFRFGYAKGLTPSTEIAVGYTLLVADFSGSDLGYGLDLGANYFPFTTTSDEAFKDENISASKYSNYRPYVGAGFYQRQFQSIRSAFAGFGANVGVEKYWNKDMNFKAETRFINLAGSSQSEATEINLFFGIVFKL